MDITLGARSEQSGRFNFVRGADGDVSFDDTEAHAVVTSAIERRGFYWANPLHGSDLHELKHLTSKTPSQAEAMVLEAETSLEDSNAIVNVQAKARPNGNRLTVKLSWDTPGGSGGEESVDA